MIAPWKSVRSAAQRGAWLGGTLLLSLAAVAYGTGLYPLLDPRLPVFGDLGGHMVPILELRQALQAGHVPGWSFSWYGGFPLFYFYFPLPALAIVGAASLIGFAHATAAVVVSGPLLIPVAAAVLVRASGGTRSGAFLAGIGSVYFILCRSLGRSGGTLESALVGEYSYALAMALSIFYLATLPGLLEKRTGRAAVLPVILLTTTALSHVLATLAAVIGSLAFVRRRRDVVLIAGTWSVAFLLSGWWSVPFLGYAREMTDLDWAPPAGGSAWLWVWEGLPPMLLAGIAVLWPSSPELDRRIYRLALILVAAGLAPFALPGLPIYPGRLLPYAFWAAMVLSAVVCWQAIRSVRRRRLLPLSIPVLLCLGALVGWGIVRERTPLERLARVALQGEEVARDRSDWVRLTDTLGGLPPGAIIASGRFPAPRGTRADVYLLNRWGALRHLPRLTGHRLIGGLWQESSRNAPFASLAEGHLQRDSSSLLALFDGRTLDPGTGVNQARLLGARYVLLARQFADEEFRPLPGAHELARDSLWTLYEIDGAAVAMEPGPLGGVARDDFAEASWRWFELEGKTQLPVLELPSELAETGGTRVVAGEPDIQLLQDEIRIDGVTPGRPLLIRLSFFPGWKLASPGRGPFRAAPNHILIVPEAASVRLVFRRGVMEHAGVAASVLGLILVLALGLATTSKREGRGR